MTAGLERQSSWGYALLGRVLHKSGGASLRPLQFANTARWYLGPPLTDAYSGTHRPTCAPTAITLRNGGTRGSP